MSCGGCCPEPLKKSDVDKWTDHVSQVMASEEGRRRFVKYLEDRELNDALTVIGFLHDCEDLLQLLANVSNRRADVRHGTIRRRLRDLVEVAEDLDLYEAELERVRELLQEESLEEINRTLTRLRSRAHGLIEIEHREFSKYLIKEFKKPCKSEHTV